MKMKPRLGRRNSFAVLALMSVLGVFTLCGSAFAGAYGGGTGELNDPYLIYTAEQMQEIGANPADWSKHFKLMADIDLSSYTETSYNIIGNSGTPFRGVFDGNDHTISNFNYAYSGSNDYIGLFGYIDGVNALIKNLTVADANIFVESSDCEYIGSIAGRLYRGSIVNCRVSDIYIDAKKSNGIGGLAGGSDFNGKIDGCFVSGSITGQFSVGGLLGVSYGIINNCHTSIALIAGQYSGGLVALAHNPIITGCSSAGSVFNTKVLSTDGEDTDYGGGLIAESYSAYGNPRDSVIKDSYSSCEVSADGDKASLYGGLIGVNFSDITIINCSATGNVSAGSLVGGLVGANYGDEIKNCYATGDVNGLENVGGLVGDSEWDVIQSYSTGNVTGEENVGGLVGRNDFGNVYKSFSTGDVTGVEHIGGLVGENIGWQGRAEEYANISNSYARGNVTGQTSVGGLVGYQDEGNIFYSYSTGAVGGNSSIGGLVGGGEQWEVTNSFWDVITSGQTTSAGGMGKITEEMMQQVTFTGWDFNTPIWKVSDVPDYPYLWWEGPMVSILEPEDNSLVTKSFVDIYITFNRPVAGVDTSDILLSGDASVGATVGIPIDLCDNIWQFPITGLVDGTLDITLASEPNDIEDANGNDLQPRPTRWSYNVFVLTPVLQAEPEITLGTSNVISWDEVNNAEMYYVECANTPNFTTIYSNSDWIYNNSFDFNELILGETYWYRVKAKTLPQIMSWSQTDQEEFASDILSGVSTSVSPGNVILAKVAPTIATETIGDTTHNQLLTGYCMFNHFYCHTNSVLTEIEQYIEPSSNQQVRFAVYESLSKGSAYDRIHLSSISVVAGEQWCSSGSISVPLVAGRYYYIGTGWSNSSTHYYAWGGDKPNISWGKQLGGIGTLFPPPAIVTYFAENQPSYYQRLTALVEQIDYVSVGNIITRPIELPNDGDWVNLSFNITTPNNTNLTVDVLDAFDDSIIIADANSPEDLSEITAALIKLRANLSTNDPNVTPALHDWSVTYTDPTTIIESDWSNVESSLQGTLADAVSIMLDPNSLKNENMKNALTNKIDAVLEMIDEELYAGALKKLENDILQKTDGCADTGEPDKNDWIITCEEQEEIYPFIIETIEYVKSLM